MAGIFAEDISVNNLSAGNVSITGNVGIGTTPFSQYNDPTLDVGGSTFSTRYRAISTDLRTNVNILEIPNTVSRLYGLNVNFAVFRGALLYTGRMYGVFRKKINQLPTRVTRWNMIGEDFNETSGLNTNFVEDEFTRSSNGTSTYTLTFKRTSISMPQYYPSEIIINLTIYYLDL